MQKFIIIDNDISYIHTIFTNISKKYNKSLNTIQEDITTATKKMRRHCNKFDILLENRLYTEREFDIYNMKLLSFFNENIKKQLSILNKINVLKEDYDKILNVFNKIAQIYDL